MLKNNYSVVAYPVSYHVDTFKENKACFENKICFSINKNENKQNYGEGRGGDKSNYVWALLDWRGSSSNTNRTIYNSNNGPSVNKLTQNKFNTWLGEMRREHNISVDIMNL